MGDMVNHPDHYTSGGIECIDAIEAALTPDEFRGFLKGNCIKYIWRSNLKGQRAQDCAKAAWFASRLASREGGRMDSGGETNRNGSVAFRVRKSPRTGQKLIERYLVPEEDGR